VGRGEEGKVSQFRSEGEGEGAGGTRHRNIPHPTNTHN